MTIEIAGEVTSAEAFEMLKTDGNAVLVDVRTVPEWQFVGVPDLEPVGKATVFLSWQAYPEMAMHPAFPEALQQQGVSMQRPAQGVQHGLDCHWHPPGSAWGAPPCCRNDPAW